jgi:hypothetical protein
VTLDTQAAGLQCSDITVYATSVEKKTPSQPGEIVFGPKWIRSGQASGKGLDACSYSIAVPGNSAFYFSIGADSTNQCHLPTGGPTPDPYVTVNVPLLASKTYDFTATMGCSAEPK